MKECNRYNLIENGKVAHLGITMGEVYQIFGKRININYYLEAGRIYKKRYQIELYTGTQDELFIHNWNKTCKLFQNVEWVKTGGKRLHLYED